MDTRLGIYIASWKDIGHPEAGGSEQLVHDIACGLASSGHDVTVATPRPHRRSMERPYRLIATGGFATQFVKGLGTYVRYGRRADVVVDVSNGLPMFLGLLRRRGIICHVNHVHREQWIEHFPRLIAAIGTMVETRFTPWLYRRFTTISPSTTTALIELGVEEGRISTIPVGVVLPCCGIVAKSEAPTFVAVGRDVPHKRLDLLIDMWRQVRPVTGGTLLLVGCERDLRNEPGVQATGFVDVGELRRLVGSAWLLVHAASREGWGLVVSEAAALGTASIGFDVAGVRDAIRHGETGLLAADESEFIRLWIAAGTSAEMRLRLQERAQGVAASEGYDAMIERWNSVVHTAAADRRSPERHPAPVAADHSVPLSVVIPAFNEADRLGDTLIALRSALPEGSEIVVVDDGSHDDTSAVAHRALAGHDSSKVVRLASNSGKGAAVRAGVMESCGTYVLMMDADLATDLSALAPALALGRNFDVVIGSRATEGSDVESASVLRAVTGRTFNLLVRVATGLSYRDTQCGFKLFTREAAQSLFAVSRKDGFAFDVEILLLARRQHLRVAELPVRWTMVQGTRVRLVRDSVRMAAEVLTLRTLLAWRARPGR